MHARFLIIAASAILLCISSSAIQAADKSPVKVFILAGQSNMVGHGKSLNGLNPDFDPKQKQSRDNQREIPGGIGCLAWAVETMPDKFGPKGTHALVDENGNWVIRDDVNVYVRMEVFKDKQNPGQLTNGITRKGKHTVGFGKANSKTQKWNGPEHGFGKIVGDAMDDDILIIKVATGGTSLYGDWRSPMAARKRGGKVGYMWPHLQKTVKHVLDNLDSEFPEYAGRDYEIVGFGWHQGFNDAVNKAERDNYAANLVDFIADIRSVYGEDLPFVIGTTSMYGDSVPQTAVEAAQLSVAAKDPRTTAVNTRPFYRGKEESPSTLGFHWNHNGLAHYEIGAGMGEAMIELIGESNSR